VKEAEAKVLATLELGIVQQTVLVEALQATTTYPFDAQLNDLAVERLAQEQRLLKAMTMAKHEIFIRSRCRSMVVSATYSDYTNSSSTKYCKLEPEHFGDHQSDDGTTWANL